MRQSELCYAECRYVKCYYADCRGAMLDPVSVKAPVFLKIFSISFLDEKLTSCYQCYKI
jgi:hypothetical protein